MNKLQVDIESLYQSHKSAFDRYASLLVKWNQKINLTSMTDPEEIRELHFLDSLAVSGLIPPSPSIHFPPAKRGPFGGTQMAGTVSRETSTKPGQFGILDIGAGGGFPGIPLKIVRPEARLVLVDSVKKKCDFMKEVVRTLALKEVEVIHGRASEERSFGRFDMVVSRATFSLSDLIRFALPNLRAGGRIVAMKGKDLSEELDSSRQLLEQHRLCLTCRESYELERSGRTHTVAIIENL